MTRMRGDGQAEPTDDQVRRWLTLLRQPDRLGETDVADFLVARGMLPASRSPLAIGKAAAELILSGIERLKPAEGSTREEALPYEVLRTSFVEGAKRFQAGARLGLSERQLTRERTRAIRLLRGEFPPQVDERRSDVRYVPEPIPSISGYMARPSESRRLVRALDAANLILVHGPPGIGKTSVVAEYAAEAAKKVHVFWYRFREGVNVSLIAMLLDLGSYLRADNPGLAAYLRDGLPDLDVSVATRLAIDALASETRLIVCDDYHVASSVVPIASFLSEIASRLDDSRVIVISRQSYVPHLEGQPLDVQPLGKKETVALLARFGIKVHDPLARRLHNWTGGNPHLVQLAASWMKTATPAEQAAGFESFSDQVHVRRFLFSTVTDLLDSDDRSVLEAASVFRDRFNDEALAHVSGRSRGTVHQASTRLIRAHIASRFREGDTAFFHASVREYVYDGLDEGRKRQLHARAAEWYEAQGRHDEVKFHLTRARG